MRIFIEKKRNGYCVCQGDDAEIVAGPFDTYDDAEIALNEINPPGDDTYEENR